MTSETSESKALRLARYLKEFVRLRSTTIRNVDKYESVLWFGEIPQEPECLSPAWNDEFEPGDPWLEVRKQQFPKPPIPPEIILPWIDEQALKRAAVEMPALRPSRLEPDLEVELGDDEEPPLIERHLDDFPEVIRAYEQYRPAWQAWSAEYRRRGEIQEVYAELFHLHTQVQKQGEIVELVLGMGLLDWHSEVVGKVAPIRRHVVTARVDLHFDAATGVIRLVAAADGALPRIEDDMLEAELRPERGHYASVEQQLKDIDDDVWDRARTFRALKSWAVVLHADSDWSPDLKPAVSASDKPMLSFAPALILRKRTQAGMVRVYDEIIHQLESDTEEVPRGWSSLTFDEDDRDAPEQHAHQSDAQVQSIENPGDIFFPLFANREQRRIVQAINHRRGVLVQGPPGTGKSHTIANLMCHLLATGKRVLITAETGRALQVLKGKLPTEIRPLCVSLLGQGGDAFAELNSAVQGITTRFAAWSPGAYDERIKDVERELTSQRRVMAEIDTELRSLREGETISHNLMNGTYQGSASAIAERVANEREHLAWLQIPLQADDRSPLTQNDMLAWLRIRRSYDEDSIAKSKLRIVGSSALPTPEEFGKAVTSEEEAKEAVLRLAEIRNHEAYKPAVALVSGERAKLVEVLQQLIAVRRELFRASEDWLSQALTAALRGRSAGWQALHDQSSQLIDRITRLLNKLGSTSISIPRNKKIKVVRADAKAVIDYLHNGGKWTAFGIITPKAVKERLYLRDQVTVDGSPADTIDRLRLVCIYIDLNLAFAALDRVWENCGGLPRGTPTVRLAAIKEQVNCLGDSLAYAEACAKLGRRLRTATPAIPEPDWLSADVERFLEIVQASALEERRRLATLQVSECLGILKSAIDLHDTHPVVATLIETVERRDVKSYSEAYHHVLKVEQTKRDQELREHLESVLVSAAPRLIESVSHQIDDPVWDERFAQWEQAWQWAIADNWLQKRSDLAYQQRLWRRRHDAEKRVGEFLAEAVALRAWTHFFSRLSAKEAAALKAWREAVKAMGKGTGRSAKMEWLRRQARQYMDECRQAIPIWIMPRYLVAGMVDPAPNRYDLVIVDEASQLGIESLFLFYIAKKMVVVGDDQQISPYGVGIRNEAVADLQARYLDGISNQVALLAQSSLYANAKIRFRQNIVLREHFRCMPEIIQFSNDLCYASNGTPLDPLRAYPANRLKPLVLRHVPDGFRSGSSQYAVNEPEGDAILAQVAACIADPRYAGLTMGVISLQGEAQAKYIERKLLQTLEPEVIEERRLICGDAYAFQGDERNVIFLSMVAAPNERIGTLSNESARQRFNVATSRAQDQLWLFHSANLDVLSSVCMRYRLLSYMLDPARQTREDEDHRFDSQFEEDILRLVSAKGFHVRTQVCVGDPTNHRYRIDLVVEGMQGRLAVECDGDRWHGPDRYEQDMARQRDLERAGWQFVRIRGSDFYRSPGQSLEPLWAELDRLGIKPGGIDEVAAEPPAPTESQDLRRKEVDELIRIESVPMKVVDTDAVEGRESTRNPSWRDASQAKRGATESNGGGSHSRVGNVSNMVLPRYNSFEGIAGPDPRTGNLNLVADGLYRIIETEGPMLAKRAYDTYLRGCGIKRLGVGIKKTMNKALMREIRQGRVISENELGKTGLIFSTVRVEGVPQIKVRCRGPRNFEEIPPGELRTVARQIAKSQDLEWGSEEHLRAILELFDLKRLTAQVTNALMEVLDRQDEGTCGLSENNNSHHTLKALSLRSRFRGCLLGGAAGDAMGAPVEFDAHSVIVSRFGPGGVRKFAPAYGRVGAITDDTQMTLFTAEGLIRGKARWQERGICDRVSVMHRAYLRWLMTQNAAPMKLSGQVTNDGWLIKLSPLWSRRAPGTTCISALAAGKEKAENDSKGCGGVMRIAPVGLFGIKEKRESLFQFGSDCAALTHAHPSGFLSAGFLSVLIAEIVDGRVLPEALDVAEGVLTKHIDHDEVLEAVRTARRLARQGAPDATKVESLGGGWVAEEALAIAIYCSLVASSFEEGIVLAVNHSGDSDSTGSITGNILGALLGEEAIPESWLKSLELHDEIGTLADDLLDAYEGTIEFGLEVSLDQPRYPPN